jgi:hypothetical protein
MSSGLLIDANHVAVRTRALRCAVIVAFTALLIGIGMAGAAAKLARRADRRRVEEQVHEGVPVEVRSEALSPLGTWNVQELDVQRGLER